MILSDLLEMELHLYHILTHTGRTRDVLIRPV